MNHNEEYETDSLHAPAGSLKVHVKGDEYLVRVMKPANGTSLNELQISLKRNRNMLDESFKAMHETCRDDFFKRIEKKYVDYFSPTQNALVARANIDQLIPLINVKGGIASYNGKLEGLTMEKHITKLRDMAADNVREEETKTRIGSFFIIMFVLVLATLLLFLFL